MSQPLYRINISLPGMILTPEAHALLHDALTAICDDYEDANSGRIAWVFGESAEPPEGYSIWSDENPPGEWNYSILNIEVAERERSAGDRREPLSRTRKAARMLRYFLPDAPSEGRPRDLSNQPHNSEQQIDLFR